MNNAAKILLGIAFFFFFYAGSAYSEWGFTSLPSLAATDVLLVNQGNTALNFALRPANGRWMNYKIESGHTRQFECPHCTEYEFVMRTGNKEVRYKLDVTERYALRWNRQRGLWDLYRIREPR